MVEEMAVHGRQTMVQRYSCAPGVDELFCLWAELKRQGSAVKTAVLLCEALTAER